MPFDPYYKWLGIPPAEQPPNHYRLLGISLFESDADVVSNAADQRMRHVRSFQAGRHSDCSQRLLNEIASARVCLLDPEKKREYDAALRAYLAPASPAAAVLPTAIPFASPVAASPIPSALPPALPSRHDAAEPWTPSTPPELTVGDQPVQIVATGPGTDRRYLPLAIVALLCVIAAVVAFALLSATGALSRRDVAEEPTGGRPEAVTPNKSPPAESGAEPASDLPPAEDSIGSSVSADPTDEVPVPPPADDSARPTTGSAQEKGTVPTPEVGAHETRTDVTDGGDDADPEGRTETTATTVIRLPPPDNESVVSARQRLEETVSNETPIQLIERARAAANNDADTFVILLMAKERAATAGGVRMAVAAIDELDTRFEIDAFDTKMELLTQLTADDSENIDHRWLAELALSQVGVAVKRDRDDLAKNCAMVALGSARKSGDSQLVREATLTIVKLQKP